MTKNTFTKEKIVEVSVPPLSKPRMYVQNIHDAAEDLYELEAEIKIADEKFEKKMGAKREFIKQSRDSLLKMMQEARQKHIDVSNGQFVYIRVPKSSFEITDENAAFKFAQKENLLRIDKVGMNKKLLRLPKVPKGFEQVDSESLTLKITDNTKKRV